MRNNNTTNVFFALVRAGLWEKDVCLSQFGDVNYNEVLRLSEEQSVVGLIAAGLEHVIDKRPPKEVVLQFVGQALQLEQINTAMNDFISSIVEGMREADIYALLVKGQGLAQCYERPLWRASGDIDFFLSDSNYEKAKNYLMSLSSGNMSERVYSKELGLTINPWYVEIHGTLRTGLSTRVDNVVDAVQRSVFYSGEVRSWQNKKTQIFLPAVGEDVFFVFTHYLKHFYKEGGISLRQVCDWCRLLWMFRDKVDARKLESRVKQAKLMKEWKAFAALAVDYLDMPTEAMPLFVPNIKWHKRAGQIIYYILNSHKWQKLRDTIIVGRIFPLSVLRFLPGILAGVTWLKIKERLFAK